VSFAGLLPLAPSGSFRTRNLSALTGSADRTIPPTASTSAARQLEAAGFDLTLKVVKGVGHMILVEEAETALRFLGQLAIALLGVCRLKGRQIPFVRLSSRRELSALPILPQDASS